jgi:ketosteroid isomerase-like protein
MSEENVEIVRAIMDAQARGDWPAVFAHYHPEIEWDQSRNRLAFDRPPVSKGHEAVRDWFRGGLDVMELIEYEQEELIDAGDQVLQFFRVRARGRASGIELEGPLAQVWTVSDGLVVRVEFFEDRGEALEAAGVRESGS